MLFAAILTMSIGFASAQEIKLSPQYINIENFKLSTGKVLEEIKVEYATLGTPKKNKQGEITNAVVLCHGFSGNYSQVTFFTGMVGPGEPFDTSKYFFRSWSRYSNTRVSLRSVCTTS